MLKLLGVGLFGTALANLLLFKGLSITTGSNAAILLQVEPVYALILSFFVLGERPTKTQLFGTALIVSGAVAVLCPGTIRICRGDLLILIVPLLFVTANLLAQSCLRHGLSPRMVVTMRVTWGTVLLLPYVLFSGTWRTAPWNSPLFLSSLLAVSLLGAVLSSLLWYFAIARVSLGRCTSIMSAYPVVAVACSWGFLHEAPRISQIIGLALVLAGISRLCRKETQSVRPAR
jgi:drug/metabolite transporter (DMT)-like permease